MKKIFKDTRILDAECRRKYSLTEEIMMENAGSELENVLREKLGGSYSGKKVLILCGGGNNGADGFVLARKIISKCELFVCQIKKAKSVLCAAQLERFLLCGGKSYSSDELFSMIENFSGFDAIVDCVFGSGFHGEFDEKISSVFEKINSLEGFKLACDMPSGLSNEGTASRNSFCADVTVSMGSLKLGFYSDEAKDLTGKIVCADLGVPSQLFELCDEDVSGYLLEEDDLKLPVRTKNSVHKGDFGHCVVVSGEKPGASCLAGEAALSFGCGLVSLVNFDGFENGSCQFKISPSLMCGKKIPEKTAALIFGPGFGREKNASSYFEWIKNHREVKCVLDADAFYYREIVDVLETRPQGIILTPHPKEFLNLLKLCGFVNVSDSGEENLTVSECIKFRRELIELFCRKFQGVVLLLKGANTFTGIFENDSEFAPDFKLYVNTLGTNALAKAGSGDVLSGICGALVSQGYDVLQAAVNGTLAHGMASRMIKENYSLTPEKLIENLSEL